MSCHYSPSGKGASGIPQWLPPGSVLMFTDELPPNGHDPNQVLRELAAGAERLHCSTVILDFQRPDMPTNQAIAERASALPCPVAVSAPYANNINCGVLLPPPPLWTLLADHLLPWKNRPIWLETVTEGAEVTVTEKGSEYSPCEYTPLTSSLAYAPLHIDYHMQLETSRVRFQLRRGLRRSEELLQEAAAMGIQGAVGLYREFSQENAPL